MYSISKVTGRAFGIVFLSSCFYLFEFIGQISPGVMSKELMRDLNISAASFGFMSCVFYYSYAVMQFSSGILFDHYGSRIILPIVAGVCALGFLLFGLAPNFAIASLARFIMGAASGFAFTSTLYLILRWFPAKYYAILIGITGMMGAIGAILGNIPLAIMLKHYDWREIIIFLAVIGFFIAFLIFLFVRDPPHLTPKTQKKSLQPNYTILQRIKIVMRNKQNWLLALYSFMVWAPILAFSALWGISFLERSCNISKVMAANAISFSWLGIAIGGSFIGWLSELTTTRRLWLFISALIGASSIFAIIYIQNIPLYLLFCLTFLIGFASSGQTLAFSTIRDNNQPHVCGTANGMNNMIIVASGMVFQPLIGKLLDLHWQGIIVHGIRIYTLANYRSAFAILPICYLIAFLVSLFFIKETHCKMVWQK